MTLRLSGTALESGMLRHRHSQIRSQGNFGEAMNV